MNNYMRALHQRFCKEPECKEVREELERVYATVKERLPRQDQEKLLRIADLEIDLREDGDYTFDSNGYEIHLQVREGTIAFVDSPCPDHVCEGFGWISEVYDWAACIPAQAMLTIEPVE